MADPFQNVDAAGADFIRSFADSMDARQADPTMEKIVADYLGQLDFAEGSLTVEVGAGAGAITRRIAKAAAPAQVRAFEPSEGFVTEAKRRVLDAPNASFEVADGADLPLKDGAADHVILHTVLTHVTQPDILVAESSRVLKPGGMLVVCDADFSKAALGNFPADPLDCCAQAFMRDFVTDAHLVAKLKPLLVAAGLTVTKFTMQSRVIAGNEQMLPWVVETTKKMVERGDIGQPLADALVGEYKRRVEADLLYGFQTFATAIAQKS